MRRFIVAVFLPAALLFAPAALAEAPGFDACDRLAANPDDPNRIGPGVSFFEIDAPAAIAACRAATQRYPSVIRFRYQLGVALARSKQYAEAEAALVAAADAGYAPAQADLGYLYRDLHFGGQSLATAFRWSMLAAQQGYTPAMNDVAFCYANGLGVAVDYSQALEWYRRAVKQGDRYAQKHLGDMYKLGWGVAQSDDEALRLYQLSADQGYRGGQTALGMMYVEGRGVPKDVSKALALLKLAAAQEEPEAIEELRVLARTTAAPSGADEK